MYCLRKVAISVGFSRSHSKIGAWEGGHIFTREVPAAQNAEDCIDRRQLATCELNWCPNVLIKLRQSAVSTWNFCIVPGLNRMVRPDLCCPQDWFISRWKPVLDPAHCLQLQDHAGTWHAGVHQGCGPGQGLDQTKAWCLWEPAGPQDMTEICASCHFNVILVTPPEINWR